MNGIDSYKKISDGAWGYLFIYDDFTYYFDSMATPTRMEILKRWGRFLTDEKI